MESGKKTPRKQQLTVVLSLYMDSASKRHVMENAFFNLIHQLGSLQKNEQAKNS